jgi:hypothetical protein
MGISGICSACRANLLGRLDDTDAAKPEMLLTKLKRILKLHVAEKHSAEVTQQVRDSHAFVTNGDNAEGAGDRAD